jgi:hypothetical protein
MLIANAAAFVALLVAYPVVGRGWFDAGGLLIVLIGVRAYLRRRRRSN